MCTGELKFMHEKSMHQSRMNSCPDENHRVYYLCTRTYAELSLSFRKMFREQTLSSGNNIIGSDI